MTNDPLVGDVAPKRALRYATCTRAPCAHQGRITDLIKSGKCAADLAIAPLDSAHDWAMICGSLPFIREMQDILTAAGFTEGSNAASGDFVVEKAFAG